MKSDFKLFTEFISACTQLKTLVISGWNEFRFVLPAQKFSNLRDFKLIGPLSNMEINEFVRQNPQIENLEVCYSLELCRLVNDEMSNIRKLALYDVLEDIDSTSLKDLMQSEIEITTDLNRSMENIFAMKNITKLWLNLDNLFDESILIELTRNLCNLQKLTIQVSIHRDYNITTELLKMMLSHADQLIGFYIFPAHNFIYRFYESDYFEILDIVKSRANHKNLNIEIIRFYTLFNSHAESVSAHKAKFIHFNMNRKLLTVSIIYEYYRY